MFRAGSRRYAVPTSLVREIARTPGLTRVPLAPPQLLGLGIVRGETLAVVAPEETTDAPAQLLVLDGPHRAALAIDRVERLLGPADASEEVDDFALAPLLQSVAPAPRAARQRAQSARHEARAAASARVVLLRLAVSGQHFALPIAQALAISRIPEAFAPVPHADAAVVGTMAFREGTIAVFALAALLGLPAGPRLPRQRVVVVPVGGHQLGLLVDGVEGLLDVAATRIDPAPETLARGGGEARIATICRPEGEGRLVPVLAADQLLDARQVARLHSLVATGTGAGQVAPRPLGTRLAVLPLHVGTYRLAVPLASVRRVLRRPPRCTPVPGAPPWLIGVAPVDGTPLAVIDQSLRLTGRGAEGRHQRLLVMGIGDARLGFLVDAVGKTLHADTAGLAPAPLPEALAGGIFGDALQLDADGTGGAMLLLDPAALISSAERDFAARGAR